MSKQSSQRLPAPTLFVGPRSHNASTSSLQKHTSSNSVPTAAIPGPGTPLTATNTRDSQQKSLSRVSTSATYNKKDDHRGGDRDKESAPSHNNNNNGNTSTDGDKPTAGVGLGLKEGATGQTSGSQRRPRRGTAVLDAHWAALQSTLSDIELSASSSSHVFSSTHASALEDLRSAQVELARAWAESSLDTSDTTSNVSTAGENRNIGDKKKSGEKAREEEGRRKGSVGNTGIEEAARRREVSDRYFERVKMGVGEVVGKLEVVGLKMRAVEMQSREIWGEGAGGQEVSSLGS